MKRAIILNQSQAQIFADQVTDVDEVISFCPSAAYFLSEKRYKVTSTADIYGAGEHAEVVRLIDAELPRLVSAAARQYDLEYAEAEGLQVYLYHYLCCAYHFYFSLRALNAPGDGFIWVDAKQIRYGDYAMMFESIAAQPTAAILSYAYTGYSTPHYLLAALYNRITAYLIARDSRIRVIDYGDELPRRIVTAMIENGDAPLLVNTHHVSKNAYKTTRFFFKSLSRILSKESGKPAFMFRAHWPARYKERAAPFAIPEMHAKEVQGIARQMVERFIPFARAEVEMGKQIVRAVRPQIAVSDHAKYAYILGGLEVLRAQGGRHAMLNHGTHTIQYEGVSKKAALLWAQQERAINRNTTHVLPKSPLTAELVKEIRPTRDYELVKINVYGKIENKASREGKFVILQAGNYTDAFNHIPWCKETGDEYLLAIIELLEEVANLDNVELIIKLKNKKAGTHKKIVEGHIRRLGISEKARVDTTSRFADVMARAHVVVCNLSGTIEEAVANNIPLMIHTWRKSYFHIAPETVKESTIDGLAPAYLVKERADIGRIVKHLDANRARLNDPALYQHVAWQEKEQKSMRDLARMLVEGIRP